MVAADLNGAFPNYESSINNYNEKHSLLVTGLNAEWNSGNWSGQASTSRTRRPGRKNRWEAIYLSDVFPPEPGVRRARWADAFRARHPALIPADPSIQSAGGFRSNSGSNVNGTGQSDGPEHTDDRIWAVALNFTRTFETENPSSADVRRALFGS